MKKQSFFALIAIAALMATTLTNCGKGKLGDGALADFVPAEASAQAQAALVTVQDAVYEAVSTSAALNDVPGSVQIGSCPVVTFTPKSSVDSFPAKLKVDFGTGCDWRGHTVSGSFELNCRKKGGNQLKTIGPRGFSGRPFFFRGKVGLRSFFECPQKNHRSTHLSDRPTKPLGRSRLPQFLGKVGLRKPAFPDPFQAKIGPSASPPTTPLFCQAAFF